MKFEGGPLDGRMRIVPDSVHTFVMQVMDVRSDYVWDWDVGGFVYIGALEDLTDEPPASVRTLTYRRAGEVFRLADEVSA